MYIRSKTSTPVEPLVAGRIKSAIRRTCGPMQEPQELAVSIKLFVQLMQSECCASLLVVQEQLEEDLPTTAVDTNLSLPKKSWLDTSRRRVLVTA